MTGVGTVHIITTTLTTIVVTFALLVPGPDVSVRVFAVAGFSVIVGLEVVDVENVVGGIVVDSLMDADVVDGSGVSSESAGWADVADDVIDSMIEEMEGCDLCDVATGAVVTAGLDAGIVVPAGSVVDAGVVGCVYRQLKTSNKFH
jgi:hypothetical protein